MLRYAREVAFATAEVYARAAEVRGAWDARLEALVVDAVLRSEADEALLSRASALGWPARGDVAVVLGTRPGPAHRDRPLRGGTPRGARRRAWTRCARCRASGSWCCSAGSATTARPPRPWRRPVRRRAGRGRTGRRRPRPAPTSPPGPRSRRTARPPGWPEAPRPVRSSELLPERALAGDGHARRHLVEEIYLPLAAARGHADRDAGGVLRPRLVDGGDRPRAVRAPQHRALPAAPGRPSSPGYSPTDAARRVHPRRSRWCWAASPAAATRRRRARFVGFLQRIARADSCAPEARSAARIPAEWTSCSSSSLPVRAPRPPASSRPGSRTRPSPPRFEWLSTVAGLDLAHYGTEADADDDPRHPDRPAAAGRRPAWSRPSSCSRTRPTPSRRSARSPATASAS